MVEVRWTSQALEDIKSIAEFISRDSVKYAEIQVERFFAHKNLLATNCRIGRIVPEVGNDQIRELITGSYRIIYTVIHINRVDVITVHHSSRLLINNPTFRRPKP